MELFHPASGTARMSGEISTTARGSKSISKIYRGNVFILGVALCGCDALVDTIITEPKENDLSGSGPSTPSTGKLGRRRIRLKAKLRSSIPSPSGRSIPTANSSCYSVGRQPQFGRRVLLAPNLFPHWRDLCLDGFELYHDRQGINGKEVIICATIWARFFTLNRTLYCLKRWG